jgi:hypothetical protein
MIKIDKNEESLKTNNQVNHENHARVGSNPA